MNNKKLNIIIFIFYINIYFINAINILNIYVDPSYGLSYSDNCGGQTTPCKSLQDASKVALNVLDGSSIVISVYDPLNNLPDGDSLGNLYPLCSVTLDTTNTVLNINGYSAKSPFFSYIEYSIPDNQYSSCATKNTFTFKKINFNHWDQVVFKSSFQQLDSSNGYGLQLTTVSFINSSNAINHEPSNSLEYYNSSKATFGFNKVLFQDLVSTSSIAPVHIIGGQLQILGVFKVINIDNCKTNSSPFFYLKSSSTDQIAFNVYNSEIINHPFLFIDNPTLLFNSATFTINNNTISSILQHYTSNSPFQVGPDDAKSLIITSSNNTYRALSKLTYGSGSGIVGFNNLNDYQLSFGVNKMILEGDTFLNEEDINNKVSLFNLNNIKLNLGEFQYIANQSILQVLFKLYYSNLAFPSVGSWVNSSIIDYPLVGKESIAMLPANEDSSPIFDTRTLCLCLDCNITFGSEELKPDSSFCDPSSSISSSSDSNTPTPSSTITPTPSSSDDLQVTKEPQDNKKKNNIIIIFVVLGVAAISSIVIFSIVFKRHREKKFLLNSSSNVSGSSSDLGEQAGASIDNDVSPNLESVLYDEDEDYAGLEKL